MSDDDDPDFLLTPTAERILSDYLWAQAVILTSATVATVGTGLTIPLAFVSDSILHPTNKERIFLSMLGRWVEPCRYYVDLF